MWVSQSICLEAVEPARTQRKKENPHQSMGSCFSSRVLRNVRRFKTGFKAKASNILRSQDKCK